MTQSESNIKILASYLTTTVLNWRHPHKKMSRAVKSREHIAQGLLSYRGIKQPENFPEIEVSCFALLSGPCQNCTFLTICINFCRYIDKNVCCTMQHSNDLVIFLKKIHPDQKTQTWKHHTQQLPF
jgi:hypothetical protein